MTKQVDFYLLNADTPMAQMAFVCRLANKAYEQKHRLYVHCEDKAQAERLDELMWTYEDNSFIPHNIIGEGPNNPPPVQLGFEKPPAQGYQLIINLSPTLPEFVGQFKRAMEIVINNENIKAQARDRYKHYRELGFAAKTHHID